MKTIRLLILGIFLFGLLTPISFAQKQVKQFRYAVKTNPLAALGGPFWIAIVPMTGEYKVYFEVATGMKQSFQIGVSYLGPSVLINLEELSGEGGEIDDVKIAGFRTQGMYKFFLTRGTEAPEGFYVGPYISYSSANVENKDDVNDNFSAKKITYDAALGYQLITDGGFSLDVFTGFGLRTLKWDYEDETNTQFDIFESKNAGHVAFGFSFGIAF